MFFTPSSSSVSLERPPKCDSTTGRRFGSYQSDAGTRGPAFPRWRPYQTSRSTRTQLNKRKMDLLEGVAVPSPSSKPLSRRGVALVRRAGRKPAIRTSCLVHPKFSSVRFSPLFGGPRTELPVRFEQAGEPEPNFAVRFFFSILDENRVLNPVLV